VGLGVASNNYQQLGNDRNGGSVPVQLTGGYQLRPRLAVQVGLTYSGNSDRYDYSGLIYSNPSMPDIYYTNTGRGTTRRVSGSVLGRYTLTRKAAHRLQFDVLGGFGLEHQSYRSRGTQTRIDQQTLTTNSYDERSTYTDLVFTLGPNVRYRFGERLELVYDLLFNTDLRSKSYLTQGITGGMALGLRYRFGPALSTGKGHEKRPLPVGSGRLAFSSVAGRPASPAAHSNLPSSSC
jgi:hypothetical protein